jgi:hypothetical protein
MNHISQIGLGIIIFCLATCGHAQPGTMGAEAWQSSRGFHQMDSNRLTRDKDHQSTSLDAGQVDSRPQNHLEYWGPDIDGIHLGLISKTNVFTVGQAMPMEMLLWNSSPDNLAFLQSDGAPEFSIKDESGKELWSQSWPGTSTIWLTNIGTKTRLCADHDLNRDNLGNPFLKAGTYKIKARYQLVICPPNAPLTSLTNGVLCSDTFVIQVTAP